jgi:hypothetical protein
MISILFLTSCNSEIVGDIDIKTLAEKIEIADYVLLVKVNETSSITQNFYFEGTVPKTDFSLEVIESFKGDIEGNISISAKGGYDENNSFIGVYGDVINDENATYNLLLDNQVYVILIYMENDKMTLWDFELIENYIASETYENQSVDILNTLEKYE